MSRQRTRRGPGCRFYQRPLQRDIVLQEGRRGVDLPSDGDVEDSAETFLEEVRIVWAQKRRLSGGIVRA